MSMQEVELFGGPWDGRHVALESEKRDLWLIEPSAPLYGPGIPPVGTEVISTRKGRYEAHKGSEGRMYWQGWIAD